MAAEKPSAYRRRGGGGRRSRRRVDGRGVGGTECTDCCVTDRQVAAEAVIDVFAMPRKPAGVYTCASFINTEEAVGVTTSPQNIRHLCVSNSNSCFQDSALAQKCGETTGSLPPALSHRLETPGESFHFQALDVLSQDYSRLLHLCHAVCLSACMLTFTSTAAAAAFCGSAVRKLFDKKDNGIQRLHVAKIHEQHPVQTRMEQTSGAVCRRQVDVLAYM